MVFGLADSQAACSGRTLEPCDQASRGPDDGARFQVLIVDDDPTISARLRDALDEDAETQVTLCATGDEAARLLGLECALPCLKPDLCLLSAEAEGMTGIELLSMMRRTADLMAIPVALVLHRDDERLTYRAMDEGANGIIAAHADAPAYCDAARRIADFWRRVRSAS